MKFFKAILCLIGITIICMGYYQYKITQKPVSEVVDDRLSQSQQKLDEAQSKLDKIKEQENAEKLRKLELEQLQNPEIINKELLSIGKLITYEGSSQYSDVIKESSWLGSKELDLQLTYNFGIAIDLTKITVEKFYDKTVVLQIPKSELMLDYIEVNTKDTKVIGSKQWFAKNYTPNETKLVLDNAQAKTKEKIESDKDIFNKAMDNLKVSLKDFICKLGYDDVIFDDVN